MKFLPTQIADRLARDGFVRRIGQLLGGAFFAQGLAFLASPIIARLYSPQDYGALGIYMSVLGIASPITMLRYEAAIPGCKEDHKAAYLLLLCLAVATVMGLAGWAVIESLARAHTNGLGPFVAYPWILPVGMCGTASYQVLSFWAIRRGDFPLLARTKSTQGLFLVGTQLLLGVIGSGSLGLILGHVAGQSGGIGSLFARIRNRDKQLFAGATAANLVVVARQFKQFPKYSVGAALIESITNNAPLLFVASNYGAAVAGWLTLVQRLIALPFATFSNNIGQVYFAELAELKRTNPEWMLALFDRRLKQLSVAGLTAGILAGILAPVLIPLMFGARWRPAVVCLEISLPLIVLGFVAGPFGSTLDVLERQDLHLLRDVSRGLIMAAVLAGAFLMQVDWEAGVAAISLGGSLGYITYLALCRFAVRRHIAHLAASIGEERAG